VGKLRWLAKKVVRVGMCGEVQVDDLVCCCCRCVRKQDRGSLSGLSTNTMSQLPTLLVNIFRRSLYSHTTELCDFESFSERQNFRGRDKTFVQRQNVESGQKTQNRTDDHPD
jgi:hypothetical protein